MRVVAAGLALSLLAAGGLVAFGEYRWRKATALLVRRLDDLSPAPLPVFRLAGIRDVPPPVHRYLTAVLHEGQPAVRRARLEQRGDFLVSAAENRWGPFEATHHVAAAPPGFVWDARIRMAPSLAVRVRDGFVGGGGQMFASFMGVKTVVRVEGTPEVAAAALLRWLAEAVWIPTALVPGGGVEWTPIDDLTARATVTAGRTTVSLDFGFGPDGLVRTVFAAARGREVDGRSVPTPWRGRWTAYAERSGMRIPVAGEVEWVLPGGPELYWRGRVEDAAYEF